jgi:hypothetical protein
MCSSVATEDHRRCLRVTSFWEKFFSCDAPHRSLSGALKKPQRSEAVADKRSMILPESQDRRSEPRALTAAIVRLVDEYGDGSNCVLEDLSRSGALLHTDFQLSPGAEVDLEINSVTRVAVVRHCSKTECGFSIGVAFTNELWPEPIRMPVHWIANSRQDA